MSRWKGPEFGRAVDARPLWSARDWAAEQARVVLRAAGCPEFPARAGFSVESHDPLALAVTDDFTDPAHQPAALARATRALAEAGYRTAPHPWDNELVAVWPRPIRSRVTRRAVRGDDAASSAARR
ncbi:hypothetical protein E1292_36035 [Nonomuraea deserti]|uniref:Uncharacterized protein n=1 Tax=Nonomuraea deserti TaxID=1848322 RepID=A0A4R4VEG4_9ACTN|nr:hypothetical protein [Nonomuraea deserti]TDC98019.1 hypothetical protein E1292_36035 [Nonomuraea deserti]